jgi:hypothetical protein
LAGQITPPVTGAALLCALAPLIESPRPADARLGPQAPADACVDILRNGLPVVAGILIGVLTLTGMKLKTSIVNLALGSAIFFRLRRAL